MRTASTILFLSIFVTSCTSGADSAGTPSSESTPVPIVEKIGEEGSWVIYRTILTEIRQNPYLNGTGSSRLAAKDPLVYRLETVSPRDFSPIADQSDISAQLEASFVQANQHPLILKSSYDVLDWTESATGSPEIEVFYYEVRKRSPKTKAVLNLSGIGIDGRKALVYVEYYSEFGGRRKAFLLLQTERSQTDSHGLVGAYILRMIVL